MPEELFNDGFCFFDSDYRCINCGHEVKTKVHPLNIVRSCTNPRSTQEVINSVKVPGIIKRLGNFGVSYLKHLASGVKEADQTEIDRRFSTCLKCTLYYDAAKGICKQCGCNVNNSPAIERLNKLAWQESECPESFW
jgi:hypothetical protein